MHDRALGPDAARAGGSGADAPPAALDARRFFSENPDKAWTERAVLLGSVVWMAAVAVVILTGWLRAWGEAGYLAFSVFAALPVTVGPLLLRPKDKGALPIGRSFLLKLNLFVAILVFFGTYFGTHYFFDLMGMRYAFPTKLVFDAELLGKSGMHVPVFMYPLTQAYFMTYFTALVVADRGLRRALRLGPSVWGKLGGVALVLVLSYAIAFAETFFMATDWMKDLFSYDKRGRMLAIGSIGYALYFVVGLPLVRELDEDEREPWSLGKVALMALAACMLILILLEAWAKLVGRL